MKNRFLKNVKRIHFIGIGGVGVSAIARMARLYGIKVTGSDRSEGVMTERIKIIGGKIFIGHKKENLYENTDFVVYSPAVKENNPELIYAKELNIPCYSYPEILGLISKDMYTIAVSGTHGKTTTVSMLAEIFIYSNLDPSVVIGGLLKKQKDNFVLGESNYFIVEACEYKESFLSLSPDILIITNIDNDHLDYYKNINNIQNAFAKLVSKTKEYVICDLSDKNIQKAIKGSKVKIIDYTKQKIDFDLLIPGKHNIMNAKSALAVSQLVGIKEKAKEILKKYSGTWRRFDLLGKTKNNCLVYTDYAHHPTEVKAVIQGAKEKYPDKKLIVVFQPHLFSRTKFFLKGFARALNNADKIILTDIYAGREKNDKSIHSKDLLKEINNSLYFSKFSDIIKYLKKEKDSIILIIGAGDVYIIGEKIV